MAKGKRRSPNRTATRATTAAPAAEAELISLPEPRQLSDEAHLQVPPEQLSEMRDITQGVLEDLAAVRTRMDADLTLASVFRVFSELDGDELDELDIMAVTSIMAQQMVDLCLRAPSSTGLGLLMLLAEQGTVTSRIAAQAAADQLLADGVEPPRWAATELKVVRAWRVGDGYGEAVGVLFAYGHREHAVTVMFDRDLEGSIVDVLLAADSTASVLRAAAQEQLVERPDQTFEDLDDRRALGMLREALAGEPLPFNEESAERVSTLLYLVHARAQQMAVQLEEPEVALFDDKLLTRLWEMLEFGENPLAKGIYQLKVTIDGSEPAIWRRVEVPGTMDLDSLHVVIQAAFSGDDAEAFSYRYGPQPQEIMGSLLQVTQIASVLDAAQPRITCVYGAEGERLLDIVLEKTVPGQGDVPYPRYLDGQNTSPEGVAPDAAAINRQLESFHD
ncbi:plasmid pRiA4b ORF-3 family protein [Kineosporia babensis]|uniref:Plasmid pRiA4b ORF-3 family protein n=1 Tax=Kineosporia babensis TaxID=499548 RepID=A0A9X1N9B4_9ACTN|nr:plasmid pRiA4b ORF-3 family protein [Kineosporia babensis]MCD5309555.1 plasmid pRiA4b ORF-3 family protein [Kineosporia babensis]